MLHGSLRRERRQLQPFLGFTIEMDIDEVLDAMHPFMLEPAKRFPCLGSRFQGFITEGGIRFLPIENGRCV